MRASLALASILAVPAAALAQPTTTEYQVRPGDTCRGIAARFYGDADEYVRIHELNPELGPMPHHLEPGLRLRLERPEPPAELAVVYRRVERRDPAASTFEAARAGQPLDRGTQVRTHDESSATIRFSDRAEVEIRERTLVIVYGGERRLAQRPVTRAELESGALRSRLGELAGRRPLEIETPSALASLDGDAVVSVGEDGSSRVANHGRREATVEAGGTTMRLPAGTGTVVQRGEAPSRPRRLLPAPGWRADRSGPVIGFYGRGAVLSGGWEPVDGAERYRVEIARRPNGDELLTTLELGGRARRFEAGGLPEGTVYVSVASIDATGLEGQRSPWRAFGVRLARLVEPGGTTAALGEGAPSVWPGTWLVAPRGMTCGVEGGELSGIVTLRERGRAVLTCRDHLDNESSPLEVDVVDVVVRTTVGSLSRDRSTEVRFDLAAPHLLPGNVLVVGVPEGFRVDRPRTEDGDLVVDVWAGPNAPGEVELEVAVASGAERIVLGSITLPVRDPAGTSTPSPAPPHDLPSTLAPRPVQSAFGDVMWPSVLSLRDERQGGFGAWIYVAPFDAGGGDPQLRIGAGARAQLPGLPLRLSFASQLDLLARPEAPGRRGDADLHASFGASLLDERELGLAIDVGAWFPTRPEPESLGRVRLTPSVEGSVRPVDWLALRTRQGALVDAAAQGARLWAWALGVDVSPLPWLAVGVELDASIGSFADREGAALGVGGGFEMRLGLFELAVGARFGLTDEARALMGEWSAVLSVRVHAR